MENEDEKEIVAFETELVSRDGKVVLSKEQQYEAIRLASEGISYKRIYKTIGLEGHRFRQFLARYPHFSKAFLNARDHGYEVLADSLLDIPRSALNVERARLLCSNIKWLLGKRLPETYGDRVKVEVDVVDLRGALDAAKSRVVVDTNAKTLPTCYQGENQNSQDAEFKELSDIPETDVISDDVDIFS